MIRIRKGRAPAQTVWFEGGAWIRARPATSFETDRAGSAISKIVLGLMAGEQAAMLATAAFGDEFRDADFTSPDWRAAASNRLALIELGAQCIEAWDGFIDDDDNPLPLDRESIALVLRDSNITKKLSDILNGAVHEINAEGEGLPALRSGAVVAGENIAPIA